MNIYWTNKTKGRKYATQPVVLKALEEEGLTGLAPSHLESGRPVLIEDGGAVSPLCVSVSDTKNHIFVCFADVPVGIDAEEKGRAVKASTVRALHSLEQKYLSGLEPGSSEWAEEFLRIWTAKESYMKLCGAGLSMGTGSFSVVGEDLSFLEHIQKSSMPRGYVMFSEGPGRTCVSVCVEKDNYYGESLDFIHLDVFFPPDETALEKAAKLLDGRAYSEKELKEKLKSKGYSDDEAAGAAVRLKDAGYVDDYAYARSLARKLLGNGRARPNVVRELAGKGIDRDAALQVLAEMDEEFGDDRERALQIALKAAGRTEILACRAADERLLAKIARKLSALGYESSVILSVIGRLRK